MKSLTFLALASTVLAQSSADYALTSSVFDDSGGAQSSVDYAQVATLGGVHGISSDATTDVLRAGFAGRLYEVVSFAVAPQNSVINEATALQLTATLTLDDATTLSLASGVAWSVASGPLASISAMGLATAGNVYVDSPARAVASYGPFSETANVFIRNTGTDDFGLYAGDGLSDVWQVGWFGESNGAGRADKDPDGDGQNNAFEFLSGYSPLDGAAFFKTRALTWDGAIFQLELSRVQPGTVYEIYLSPDLIEWTLMEKIIPPSLAEPFVQPLPSEIPAAFFRVQLIKAP